MKLNMPNIGDELVLEKDWTFKLALKHNFDAWQVLVGPLDGSRWNHYKSEDAKEVSFPAGTIVRIVWFNIQRLNPKNTNITLSCQRPNDKKKLKMYVELSELNKMDAVTKKIIPVEIEWERIPYFSETSVRRSDDNFPPEIMINPPTDIDRFACKVDGKEKYFCKGVVGIGKFRHKRKDSYNGQNSNWTGYYKPVPSIQLYDSMGNEIGEPVSTFETIQKRVKKLETINE